MEIQFRPHHFLCALCFQGRGYSPAFVSNFQAIMTELNGELGDNTPIRITSDTDSICSPCPNRTGKTCTSQEKINLLDKAHSNALAIQANDVLTWGDAKKRIKDNITLETFHTICATCSWKDLGICEGVLTNFLKETHHEQNG